jgi:hypothetical protein
MEEWRNGAMEKSKMQEDMYLNLCAILQYSMESRVDATLPAVSVIRRRTFGQKNNKEKRDKKI